jgi:multicomponent Na+:H+ antiporter subunit G
MEGLVNASTQGSEMLRLLVAAPFVLAGGAVSIISAIGILRFPDFYSRLHAVALCSVLGAPLLLVGFAIAAWHIGVALKLLLLGGLIAAIAPAASHILASAAHGSGLAPRTDVSP